MMITIMKRLLFVAFLFLLCNKLCAQLVINEIMQSNIDCIMDDINEFPDSWVELYNAGNEAVELSDYMIGEGQDTSLAWRLPSGKLEPKCYKLIYCDTEATANRLHADFRLESGKGATLYLFCNGSIVDQLPEGMKKMPAPNIAFGRKEDGGSEWGYQDTPTPEAANCGIVYSNKQILGDPVFSIKGRVFTSGNSMSLTLSLPEDSPEGAEIRYTTDGSEPVASSMKYETSISISSTKIIRAKLFCKGYLSPRSTTQSYIKFPRNLTLPVVAMNTDRSYFYDTKIGIYSTNKYKDGQENFRHDWRRPMNIEYFVAEDEDAVLNQLGETRITGGATRDRTLKSLGVYANKRFGEKRLEYEFFPEDRPGVTNFKSIMLRNAGNDHDYLYMRDAIIQRSMSKHMDIDFQAWQPAIFYFNGTYLGMLNIRERSNDHNSFTNYDELEDIDMIENYNELKVGTMDNWKAFESFYTEKGHSYQEYQQYLDINEYLNVMILNIFFNNLDFPGNNIVWWRPRAEEGRWRILVKDTDFTMGLYGEKVDYNYLEWLHNPNYDYGHNWGANSSNATRLFRRLEENEDFFNEYIDRFCIYMGDFMNYNGVWKVWSPMYEMIKYEYPYHRELINKWWPNYIEELNNARNWLKSRTGIMYKQLGNYYKLGTACPLYINRSLSQSEIESMAISVNGVKLSQAKFEGQFFPNRTVILKGENVSGWKVSYVNAAGVSVEESYSGAELSFTMPECVLYSVTALVGSSAIEEVSSTENSAISDIFNPAGLRQSELQHGVNVIKKKDGSVKKVLSW